MPSAEPTFEYHPSSEGPSEVGRHRGQRIMLFGSYKVTLGDGRFVLFPHSGIEGTVGSEPSDLTDPQVQEALLQRAREIVEGSPSEVPSDG